MKANDIRERLSNGFEPFVLRLSDGRTVEVPHPDFIAVGQHVVVVVDRNKVTRKTDGMHLGSLADRPKRKRT